MITDHVITPTLDLSLEMDRVTSATAYVVRLTPAGGMAVETTATPVDSRGKHYLPRCADVGHLPRGTMYSVTVAAVVGEVEGAESTPYEFTSTVQTSRPATVRQRLYEIVIDAALEYGGAPVNIHADEWGRPRVVRDTKPTGYRGAVVDVGVAYATGDVIDTDAVSLQTVQVPFRVWAKGDDADEMEHAVNIAEAVRASVENTGLTGMGVAELGWTWSIEPPRAVEGGKMHQVSMLVTLPTLMCDRGTHWI